MSKRIKNMMMIMNNINDEHAFRHVLYTFVKIGSTQSLFIACPRDSACNINLVVLYEKAMTDTMFRFYLGHHKKRRRFRYYFRGAHQTAHTIGDNASTATNRQIGICCRTVASAGAKKYSISVPEIKQIYIDNHKVILLIWQQQLSLHVLNN